MSGIMRAPALGLSFAIPYSGTLRSGDCILEVNSVGEVSIVAHYFMGDWVYENYITDFSSGNNVISFKSNNADYGSSAAFIPGPNHV